MRHLAVFTVTAALVALVSSGAGAQQLDPADFTPEGYEWCGWRDFETGGWTYDEPPPGVWFRVFAYKMSCRDARRNATRINFSQASPDGRPRRPGYTCKQLNEGYEYSDVRCTKKHGKRKFRYQTGA